MKVEFSRQILENTHIKFNENPFSGSHIVPCGRTDGHDEADSRYSQFCERTLNQLYSLLLYDSGRTGEKHEGTQNLRRIKCRWCPRSLIQCVFSKESSNLIW